MGKIADIFITCESEIDCIRQAYDEGSISLKESIKQQKEERDEFEKEIIELIKREVIPEKPSGDYSDAGANDIINECLYNLEKLGGK